MGNKLYQVAFFDSLKKQFKHFALELLKIYTYITYKYISSNFDSCAIPYCPMDMHWGAVQ